MRYGGSTSSITMLAYGKMVGMQGEIQAGRRQRAGAMTAAASRVRAGMLRARSTAYRRARDRAEPSVRDRSL